MKPRLAWWETHPGLFLLHRLLVSSSTFILDLQRPAASKAAGTKGQLISKADWHAIDSPKKQTDEFVLFAFLLFMANKSNSFVRFLGESTARQSAFRFYLTFILSKLSDICKKTDISFFLFMANKSNSSVRFLGESTARQSAFLFYLTFKIMLNFWQSVIHCIHKILWFLQVC